MPRRKRKFKTSNVNGGPHSRRPQKKAPIDDNINDPTANATVQDEDMVEEILSSEGEEEISDEMFQVSKMCFRMTMNLLLK